ncbi:MAG TPA: efflux RND transporter periplasmic adaptor subunit, partial [Thermopolyspora sp.]
AAGGRGQATTEAQAEAAVTQAKDDFEAAKEALAGVLIKAPVPGTILSIAGTVGTQVKANGTSGFIELGNLDELQVKGMFTQSDVGHLKVGQKAVVTLATRAGKHYLGTITHIDPAATTSDQLVQYGVLIAFDRHPAGLLLGQNASITVTTDESEAAIYIPARAVRVRGDGTGTVTIDRDGRRTERTVRTGIRGEQYIEILDGLREGDQVVLAGGGGISGGFPEEGFPGLAATPPVSGS